MPGYLESHPPFTHQNLKMYILHKDQPKNFGEEDPFEGLD